MSKYNLKPLAAAVGAAFMVSVAISPMASAAENPFQANELSSGYNLADSHGEGKCGGNMDKAAKEGKCGEGMGKAAKEGKCGEGKCGANKGKAMKEGKCGEGMDKAAEEGKSAMEGKCGGKE